MQESNRAARVCATVCGLLALIHHLPAVSNKPFISNGRHLSQKFFSDARDMLHLEDLNMLLYLQLLRLENSQQFL